MARTRIGVIGAGWWATESHIPVLQALPDVEVTCICGLEPEHLRKVQKKFEIPYVTQDYKELLSRKDVDGVVVSSPHALHYQHAVAALERGFPVLCEKPMALRASEAKALVDLVESRSLPFLIPYGWNYSSLATLGRKAIADGDVGEIEHVLCHMGSPLRDLLSGTGAWVAEKSMFTPNQGTWSDVSAGGGFANGQLTHALGLMLWITGLQAARSIRNGGTFEIWVRSLQLDQLPFHQWGDRNVGRRRNHAATVALSSGHQNFRKQGNDCPGCRAAQVRTLSQ